MRMTPELAQQMAVLRAPGTILPLWSRMAICELAFHGTTYAELMQMFQAGRSTVYRAIQRPNLAFCGLSGHRQLSAAQMSFISKSG